MQAVVPGDWNPTSPLGRPVGADMTHQLPALGPTFTVKLESQPGDFRAHDVNRPLIVTGSSFQVSALLTKDQGPSGSGSHALAVLYVRKPKR